MKAFKLVLYVLIVLVALLVLAWLLGAIGKARQTTAAKSKGVPVDLTNWVSSAYQSFVSASRTGQQIPEHNPDQGMYTRMDPDVGSYRWGAAYIPKDATEVNSPDLDAIYPITTSGMSQDEWDNYYNSPITTGSGNN